MRTWLTYENGSLNPYVGRVGMFWEACATARPLMWYAIEECAYGWEHPLVIGWQPEFLLRDVHGNQRFLSLNGVPCEGGLRITYQPGFAMSGSVRITQEMARFDKTLLICRNRRPMLELPLNFSGEQHLELPTRLMFQMGCRDPTGSALSDTSGTGFDLAGVSSLRVQLRGGAPGPRSDKQTFVSYRAKRA